MHYNPLKYAIENYNEHCFETFLEDPKYESLKELREKVAEIAPEIRYENETRSELNNFLYIIIKEFLSQ